MKNLYSLSLIFLFLGILQFNTSSAQVNITNGSTTVCLDSLYDSGGPTGDYANSENLEYTISPTNAATVTIIVDSIDLGTGDTLRIHDGNSSAATLLYEFNDTSIFIPGAIVTSGGDVTVHFTSDASVVDHGFKLHWAANVPAATVSISGAATLCLGDNEMYTATPVNGGASPDYQWYVNGGPVGTNSNTYSTTGLSDNDWVRVDLDADVVSGGCQVDSLTDDSLQVTVNDYDTAFVSIAGPDSICGGDNAVYTATPVNGGVSPDYQWNVNGSPVGTNTNTYSDNSLTDGQFVWVELDGDVGVGECQVESLAYDSIQVVVTTNVTPTVTMSKSVTNVCTGDSVTFSAVPTDGGNPDYQWFKNGGPIGVNNDTLVYNNISNNDYIKVHMTANGNNGCITNPVQKDSLQISVTSNLTASVLIDVSVTNNICVGDNVTYTANPTNGGASPTYDWSINGGFISNGNSIDTDTISSGGSIELVMASDEGSGCLIDSFSTDTVVITVIPTVTASVSVAVSDPSVCDGTNVMFTATPTNGGTPAYKWTINAGGTVSTSNTYSSSTLNDGDDVECEMTSSVGTGCLIDSVSTDNIVMNINDNPSASAGSAVIVDCYGDSTGGATGSASGGQTPYTYLWDNGETTAAATMLWAGSHRVYVTDDSLCLDSADITITQNTQMDIAFVVTDVSTFGGSDGAVQATVSGGTPTWDHEWSNGVTKNNNAVSTINGVAAGTYTDTVTDNNGCVHYETAVVDQPGILLGGQIRINSTTSKNICAGDNVGLMTNETAPGGGIGSTSLTWQYSNNLLSWTNYPSSNSLTYTLNDSITQITFVRRIIVDSISDTASSNILFLNYIADQFINIIGLDTTYCQGEPVINIIGTPNNPGTGLFTATAYITAGGVFDPSLAASSPGGTPNTVVYNYTDQFGCFSSKLTSTKVFDTTVAAVSISQVQYAPNDFAVPFISTYPGTWPNLQGGGTFSGSGVIFSQDTFRFDPSLIDSTQYDTPITITFSYTNNNGCVSNAELLVTVSNTQVVLSMASNPSNFSTCSTNGTDTIIADLPMGETVIQHIFFVYNFNYSQVIYSDPCCNYDQDTLTDFAYFPFDPANFMPGTDQDNPDPTPVGIQTFHVRFWRRTLSNPSWTFVETDMELVNLGPVGLTSTETNDNGTPPTSYFLYCENKVSSDISTTFLNLGARAVNHTIESVSATPGLVNDNSDGTAIVYPPQASIKYDLYSKNFVSDALRYTYEDVATGCLVNTTKTFYTPITPPVNITTEKHITKDSTFTISTTIPNSAYFPGGDSTKIVRIYRNGFLYNGNPIPVSPGVVITWDTLYLTDLQNQFCSKDGYFSVRGGPWWSNRGTFTSSDNSALAFTSTSTADSASFTITGNSVGNQWIQYNIDDQLGCVDSVRIPFTVDTVPELNIFAADGFEFCVSDTTLHSFGGEVFIGGSFQIGQVGSIYGVGIVDSNLTNSTANFRADVAGVGNHIVHYKYTNPITLCENIYDTTITVYGLPDPSFSASDTSMCMTAIDWASFSYDGGDPGTSTYYLVGFPTPIATFDPVDNADISFGLNPVRTVFVHSTTGCENYDTIDVNVDTFPIVNVISAPGTFCYNGGAIVYSGTPASPGSTPPAVASYFESISLGFTDFKNIANDSSGSYNPTVSDIGLHDLTYGYTDSVTGCFSDTTIQIEIYDIPSLELRILNDPSALSLQHCLGDSVEYEKLINGSPDLGLSSFIVGAGFADSADVWFNPDSAGVGFHAVTYKSLDGNGCYNETDTVISVIPTSNPSFSMSDSVACIDPVGMIILTPDATPSNFGGTFKFPDINDEVTNVSTDTFYIGNVTIPGLQTVRYVYDAGFGCIDSIDQMIMVNDTPQVNFTVIDPEYCYNQGAITITVDAPSLGSSYFRSYYYPGYQDFNGLIDSSLLANGVSSVQFTPTSFYADSFVYVNYIHVDANGCEGIEVESFLIKDIPILDISFSDLNTALPNSDDDNFCALTDTVEIDGVPLFNVGFPTNDGWYTGSVFGTTNSLVINNGDGTANYMPYPLNILSPFVTDTITYHYQDSNSFGCYNSMDTVVNIKPQPITTFSIIPSDNPTSTNICPDEFSMTNSLYDSIGLYQVLWPLVDITREWEINNALPAVSDGEFNPGPAGIDDTTRYNAWNLIKHKIYDDRYGCVSEYTDSTYLDSFPVVDLSFDSALYCTNTGMVVFTGSPASPGASLPSIFTSNNISTRFPPIGSVVITQTGQDTLQLNMNAMIQPGIGAINTKDISYTYTEPLTGCTSTMDKTFKLKRAPFLGINATTTVFCPYNSNETISLLVNNQQAGLQGTDTIIGLGMVYPITPSGTIDYNPRTFLGDTASTNDIITFTHVDSNYCTETLIDTSFIVKNQPILNLNIPQFQDSVCLEDPTFALDIEFWRISLNGFVSYSLLSGSSPPPNTDQNYFTYNLVSPDGGPGSKNFTPEFDSKNDSAGVVTDIRFIGTYLNNGCYDTLESVIVTHPKPIAHFYLDGHCGKYEPVMHGDSSYIDIANFSPSDGIVRYNWTVDGYDSATTIMNDTFVDLTWYGPMGLNKIDIDLVAVSKKGCVSDMFTEEIQFLTSPNANFEWSMGDECFGDTVEFRSDGSGVPDSATTTYLWDFGDGVTSVTKEVVTHVFTSIDTFSVSLVLTEGGSACQDTSIQNVFIRPVISSFPYVNDFEDAYSGWVIWEEEGKILTNPNDPNSDIAVYFEYGLPAQKWVSGAASGSKAFATGLNQDYTTGVQTSVVGPCFDFSGMERPMIKLQTQYLVQINDGAVVQFTTDHDSTLDAATWQNVGEFFRDASDNSLHKETGINWYDKDNLFGNPGKQPNAAGKIGWTGDDTTGITPPIPWKETRHSADNTIGESYVRFRVAFGSDPAEENNGFAFDDFEVSERQQKVLFEGFTNAKSGNTTRDLMLDYDAIALDNELDVVDIQYHTSFPAADPMNQHNTADPSTRTLYYNIGEVPYVHVNGNQFNGLMSSKSFGTWLSKRMALADPLFKIDMIYNEGTKVVDVDVTAVGPGTSYPLDVTVHIAMVERQIIASEFASGTVDNYVDFKNVLKKMYPTAGGTNKTVGFGGWSESISETVNFDNFFTDSLYRIIAFVQDRNTKEVYQVDWVDGGKLGTDVLEYEDLVIDGVEYNLYPNPTNGTAYLEFKDNLQNAYEMRVYNQLGAEVLVEIIPDGSRVYQLDMGRFDAGMYFIMLNDGEHKVAIKKLMITR